MKLAMEIPTRHLEELSKHCEFDFALGQVVLQQGPNSEYVKFYRKQAEKGREVWLDNGMHELKRSLKLNELVEAARMIKATHIVAPEYRDAHRKTLHGIFSMREHCQENGFEFKVVGAWQGYKKDLLELCEHCDIVALPFDRPRTLVLQSMKEDEPKSTDFHYFGFRSFDELRRLPPRSVDTSMPIRAAIHGIDLETRERRPATPLLDLNMALTDLQLEATVRNIILLKKAGNYASEKG